MLRTNDPIRKLRRQIFGHSWPLDDDLVSSSLQYPSHSFLRNPSGQLPLLYLTQFVKAAAEHIAPGREFRDLSMLDWGCGKGHITKLLRDLCPREVISCDIVSNKGDSSFGQQTPLIEKFAISVVPLVHESELPFPDARFDLVLSFGVLEHVRNDRASVKEITRVLKPGGLFFCFHLPTKFSWTQFVARRGGDDYHDRLYTPRIVKSLLAENNLQILDIWYRSILPKNRIKYPSFRSFEKFDQIATEYTPLKFVATNIEFLAVKPNSAPAS